MQLEISICESAILDRLLPMFKNTTEVFSTTFNYKFSIERDQNSSRKIEPMKNFKFNYANDIYVQFNNKELTSTSTVPSSVVCGDR